MSACEIMSSESDVDEFFDAQDVTPVRQSRLQSKSSVSDVEGELLLDLEQEEFRLLAQKQSIEDRRRKEEEEVHKKLVSLERKKQKELERQEAAKKAHENELRRRKLEEMRLFMSDESTPAKSTSQAEGSEDFRSCLENSDDPLAAGDGLATDQLIAEKLEALSFELEQSGRLNRGDVAKICDRSQQGIAAYESFVGETFASPSPSQYSRMDRAVSSFDSDLFEDAVENPLSACGSSNDRSSMGSQSNASGQSLQKPQSRQLEEVLADVADDDDPKRKSSSLPKELSVYPCEATPEIDLVRSTKLQEPDLIQSTKSLPRHQQPVTSTPKVDKPLSDFGLVLPPGGNSLEPVAPPRRKRSTNSGTSPRTSQDLDQLSSGSSTDPDRLSVNSIGNYPSGNSQLGHRPSLDLSAATQGNRHVVATEDSAVKGVNDSEEPPATMETVQEEDSMKNLVAGDASSECDLDVVILREDSVPGATPDEHDENLHNLERELVEHESRRQRDLYLMKHKSKTLGGVGGASGSSDDIKRARSNVGRVMSDKEILEGVLVTNLDTGERIPLSEAEEKVAPSLNPLSLHIMRITKEYSSEQKAKDMLEKEGMDQGKTVKTVKVPKKRGKKIKKFLSKSVRKIKSELKSMKEDRNSSSDEDELIDGRRMIKIKASHSHKGPYDFDLLVPVQNLAEDSGGAVWTMKFSHCGKLLATGGQDNLLRIWVLKSAYTYFDGMRQKYSEAARVSPTPSQDSVQSSEHGDIEEEDGHAPFVRKPFCVYRGHTADLLDVSWSKNYFILSSSMDKTVRLWHVSRKECLCCFQHIDFVTAIAFHPKDDRYFLSGSLDGKLRLWSIPEKRVALWNEVSGQSKLITAANFCSDGKIAVGTYDGRCVLYTQDHLDYHTQIHVRSTRGKNAKGGKITGVEPYPGENKILVTSNDSRIRLYDLRDKTLTCKYRGSANNSSRIKASFNKDGHYIICGSEDGCVYIWRTQHDFYKFYSVRRDRSDFWEAVKAHVAVVTAAIFAPEPSLIIRPQFQFMDSDEKEMTAGVRGEVIISADFNGAIKVFINKFKPGSG